MKLKIPPILVTFLFALFMYLLAEYLPVGYFEFFGRYYLMYLLCFLAFLIGIVSLFQFFRAKTSIDPLAPAKVSRLVTSGLYQYSRNPMYLALLLLLLAWGLYLGNAFNTLLAAGFVFYMNTFQIIPEEEVLTNKFGKEFLKYCVMVRRWF
ncbi:isoprenylcysteine carboxylmethyltransferase family protein [Arenibacter sp. BSSL-BM3]|uniref:Isoprenylcysteine carboxylmethyltransferase family protein n=1 Tax=Arenibacter arenosicollis TaxID=2762274 RepID=A0ABR7QL33_9FLAO|nr:isoprenylcysteine carboxylmethyltransferase family protein [Arenibacter arenosicollis]MBC8767903.1 isoprenylcysteine carboxylmethyltransferase family protein [Arenibacter arenosicollis]